MRCNSFTKEIKARSILQRARRFPRPFPENALVSKRTVCINFEEGVTGLQFRLAAASGELFASKIPMDRKREAEETYRYRVPS